MLYCRDVTNVSLRQLPTVVRDVVTISNESWLFNETDLQAPVEHAPAERPRTTELVYLVVRFYVYHGVIPLIMLGGVVGNLITLVLRQLYPQHGGTVAKCLDDVGARCALSSPDVVTGAVRFRGTGRTCHIRSAFLVTPETKSAAVTASKVFEFSFGGGEG